MEHPYLYFSRNDVPALRERFTREPFLTRWRLLVSDADEILQKPPIGQEDDRMSYRYAAATAFVYAITGEKKYASRAILEVLTSFTLDIKERWQFNSVHCHGAGLGTSNFSIAAGLVYDWCYDALTEEERQGFRDGFAGIVNPLYLRSLHHEDNREECDWWVQAYHSNWSAVCHAAQGLAALAFYDEFEAARLSVRYAARHIERFIKNNIEIDGGCAEGLMYARYGIEYALYFFVASCRFFGLDTPKRELLRFINDRMTGYWDMYMLAPDLSYANFGNMDEEVMRAYWNPDTRNGAEPDLKEGPNAVLCSFYDAILPDGDPLLRWGADVGGAWYIWNGACPFHLLWRKDDAPPLKQLPVTLQDAVFFRETGQAVFNTGRLWLAFNGGLVSPDSHFNRDLGSFILLCDGERLIHDPGYGDSDTAAHSTLLVNGYGQIKGGWGEFLLVDKGDGFCALTCDLTHAYDPASGLSRFVRHMLVVDDRYVLIADELRADADSAFKLMLQTRKTLATDGKNASITGEKQKMQIAFAETEQSLGITTRQWNRKQRRTHTVISTLSAVPENQAKQHTFVTALHPGPDAPEISYDDGTIWVRHPDGTADRIEFAQGDRAMRLISVNGKTPPGTMNPHERSIKPFRDTARHELDEAKAPVWLFNRERQQS